jgi:quercetin dioxygenase-like cupin family protein
MSHVTAVRCVSWDTLPEAVVHKTIRRKVFQTDKLTIVRYEFAPWSIFPRHSHPESQVTMVLSGTLTFHYGDRHQRHEAGEVVAIPGGVPHEGRAGDVPTVALCIFVPPKSDLVGTHD